MDLLKVLVLGLIEGVTEFLPISSTAHLILAEKAIDFRDLAGVFTVTIQLGAIGAAALYFRRDLAYIMRGLAERDPFICKFTLATLLGLVPAGLVGLVLEKTIGIPDSLWLIAASLILGGLGFLYVESRPHTAPKKDGSVRYEDITWRRALVIGAGQCLALVPGVSRSGATIMTGLLAGLDRKTATVFSFYLSIPLMLAASLLKLVSHGSDINNLPGGYVAVVVGTVVSAVSAYAVIRWLLAYVSTHTFRPFAYYRIGLGLVILVVLLVG